MNDDIIDLNIKNYSDKFQKDVFLDDLFDDNFIDLNMTKNINTNNNLKNEITLLNHQYEHYNNIKNSIKKYSRALDASDTGTGKSYVSIKLCNELKLIPWIICPKSVVSTWSKIIDQYNIKKFFIITYDQLIVSKKLISHNNKDYQWNFEGDKEYKGDMKKKYLFIYDEAHRCKNPTTINSKIMMKLAEYPVNILLLSATIIDKPLFFIPFGIVLKLYTTQLEGLDWINSLTNKKSSNIMMDFHEVLFNEYASRMRIEDTVGIFKNNKIMFEGIEMKNYWEIEKKYDKINIILENNKNKVKNKLKNNFKDDDINSNSNSDSNSIKIKDGEIGEDIKKETKNYGLKCIQKIRQDIEFLRVDSIHELTLKYLTQGKSIAIFVNFTNTIKELCNRLNTKCIIWGSQTIKERIKSINDFCEDKSRIIICNIQSGSAGISLHDTNGTYPRVSIISPTWSAQDLIQVLGRIHRAMGKSDCEQQIIYCKGTIEESVGNIIKQKVSNIRSFNDGKKISKKNNMEVIINNELTKKEKEKEKNEYIYKTQDFENIQKKITKLEYDLSKAQNEIERYNINSHKYNECKFRIEKIQREINSNVDLLNITVENMINLDYEHMDSLM